MRPVPFKRQRSRLLLLTIGTALLLAEVAPAKSATAPGSAATPLRAGCNLAEYFRAETAVLSARCLADIHSLDDWRARRGEYRRQLQEMLGLWPMPERGDLRPVITGTLQHPEFTVEKLYFQALPGLYVTANLYLPKRLEKPAPAILYACGHSSAVVNGVSCGNKAGYQHHGEWFARNGYVCLVIDTLQHGEIRGTHRGTYSDGQWWWNSRGYTPAGVEAWFGIRALDYLCSRPEVDAQRIGMTGRSGGGSYTWTVAALDDRVKVAAPIAGITDLENQVVDGALEGHCDCMFFINTYRWDFPQVAALLAPRPLLIGNSDKDKLFPLDGVVRLYEQTRRIYALYGATNKLGLLITEGPHADTQDLQLPVFRWFNRFLKGTDPLIEMAAQKYFEPLQLKVFDQLPADQVNTRIQETFVPRVLPASLAAAGGAGTLSPAEDITALREQVFGGWPGDSPTVLPVLSERTNMKGLRHETYLLAIQPGIVLPLHVLRDSSIRKPQRILLAVLDEAGWTNRLAQGLFEGRGLEQTAAELRAEMRAGKQALAFFAPRGIDPAGWPPKPAQATQVRRRFMLLGQTLDGMRVWDIRCAVQALGRIPALSRAPISVRAERQMAVNSAYAALFEPRIRQLDLAQVPHSHMEGPDYLNVLKVWDIPQMLEAVRERADLIVR
jgi:hypothetical protein